MSQLSIGASSDTVFINMQFLWSINLSALERDDVRSLNEVERSSRIIGLIVAAGARIAVTARRDHSSRRISVITTNGVVLT